MNTRASSRRTLVVQRSGRRCVGAVLPWLFLFSLSGCVANQAAPARQAEWEKPAQETEQKVEQTERVILANLQRQMAAQEAEMRKIRGNLEVVQHENQVLKEQVREKAVVERDVEPPPAYAQPADPAAVPVAPSVPAGAGGPPVAGKPPALAAVPPAAAAPPAAVPPAAAGKVAALAPQVAAKPGAVAQPAATPQQMYDAAYLQLKGGQYNASREGFERFLEKYPDDTLSDNAQYWIGELYSVQKQYREALVAFNQVLVRWPTSTKVPPSLLKIGFAFYELGDLANARASLNKLITDYPDSSAVALARQRLQEIAQKEKGAAAAAGVGSGEGGGAAAAGGGAAAGAAAAKPEPPGSKRVRRLVGE